MTNEEKQLLLKDLCARLPYGIRYKGDGGWGVNPYQHTTSLCTILTSEEPLIYLRPISSMTEEEWLKLKEWISVSSDTKGKIYFGGFRDISAEDTVKAIDYLNSHHFDYRGLIPMGLALEAKEGMYTTE